MGGYIIGMDVRWTKIGQRMGVHRWTCDGGDVELDGYVDISPVCARNAGRMKNISAMKLDWT